MSDSHRSTTHDNPLGEIDLTPMISFGVREAALAGVAVSSDAAASRGGLFAESQTFTTHITCSITALSGQFGTDTPATQ